MLKNAGKNKIKKEIKRLKHDCILLTLSVDLQEAVPVRRGGAPGDGARGDAPAESTPCSEGRSEVGVPRAGLSHLQST